ncbi:MAG: hypothetical protein AAGD07_12675 [Planctomycetota bacterium]
MSDSVPPSTRRPLPWRRALPAWIQAVVLLVVFGAGIGVGVVATSRYIFARMQHYRAHPEVLPAEIAATLTSRLALTDGQSAAVFAVISKRHARIESARQASSPEIHSEFNLLEEEVNALLNNQQKQRWLETADWVRRSFLPLNPDTQR